MSWREKLQPSYTKRLQDEWIEHSLSERLLALIQAQQEMMEGSSIYLLLNRTANAEIGATSTYQKAGYAGRGLLDRYKQHIDNMIDPNVEASNNQEHRAAIQLCRRFLDVTEKYHRELLRYAAGFARDDVNVMEAATDVQYALQDLFPNATGEFLESRAKKFNNTIQTSALQMAEETQQYFLVKARQWCAEHRDRFAPIVDAEKTNEQWSVVSNFIEQIVSHALRCGPVKVAGKAPDILNPRFNSIRLFINLMTNLA